MKIGFSFGRCMRDILNGSVKFEDVLVIITATMMPDLPSTLEVAEAYWSYDLHDFEHSEVLALAERLYNSAKLHQPRLINGSSRQPMDHAIWADVFPSLRNTPPELQDAWDMYRVQLALVNGEDIARVKAEQERQFNAK